jgi:4-hydroxy-tetrahydrodipicolinate reductase
MSKAGIYGASGRVGTLLVNLLKDDADLPIGAVLDKQKVNNANLPENVTITNDIETFLNSVDVAIDFTLPVATEALVSTALEKGINKPLVIATTGLSEHQQNLITEASTKMPILYATNMSLGVAILNKLVYLASKSLEDFDLEIVEQHHRYKKDSPSGTAMTLAETCAKARELDLDKVRVSGRDGNIGERTKDEIAVMALRGGDIVGRHTVGLYNDGEFLELNHTATSRDTFAKGAIKAAKWLKDQKPGLYSINDCLGI